MKQFIFILSLIAGTSSFANNNRYQDFIPLMTGDVYNYGNFQPGRVVRNKATFFYSPENCAQVTNNTVTYLSNRILSPGNSILDTSIIQNHPVDYSCKALHIRITTLLTEAYGFLKNKRNFTGDVTVYCEPRSLSEKQILSFARRCEEQPEALCFQEEVLARFDTIKPTKLLTDLSGACRK